LVNQVDKKRVVIIVYIFVYSLVDATDQQLMEVRQGPSSNEFSQDQSTSKLPYSSAFEANFATYQSLALLVKLPGHGWMWSFDNTVRPTIFCTNVNILPNGKMLVRSLQVLKAQTVQYYFNGKQIPSNDLARSFSSIEELLE